MIKARPTVYNGIHFRSRLEATWAAFFEGLGWAWEYEHEEIAGWLPDFTLDFGASRKILVEVKPEIVFSPGSGVMKKIEKSRDKRLALLVSAPSKSDHLSGSFLGYAMPCTLGIEEWSGCYLTFNDDGFLPGDLGGQPYFGERGRLFPHWQTRRLWGDAKRICRYEV